MAIERNRRSASAVQSLKPGDFVDVRLNANVNGAMYGFVVSASAERLRVKLHEVHGNFEEAGRKGCMNWDVVFPMTSVAWVRHLRNKPVDCQCREDLP